MDGYSTPFLSFHPPPVTVSRTFLRSNDLAVWDFKIRSKNRGCIPCRGKRKTKKNFLRCVQRNPWCPVRSRIQLIAWVMQPKRVAGRSLLFSAELNACCSSSTPFVPAWLCIVQYSINFTGLWLQS